MTLARPVLARPALARLTLAHLTRRAMLATAAAMLAASALSAALPSAALAQAPEKATVGALALSSSGPIFIAKAKGYFAKEGLDVDLKLFTSAQQVPVAVASGDIGFGVTGLTAGFYNLASKGAVTIIAAQSRDEPGFPLSAYMATNAAYDAGLKTPADLKGKRIAITTIGSTFHYMVGILGQKHGFTVKEVTMVPLQGVPQMVAAFKGGQVDAVIAPSTVSRQLAADGAGRILGWVGDETPWQLGALFTSPAMIKEHRPAVEKFMRAYKTALAEYHAAFNSRDAAGKPVKGPGYDELLAIIAEATKQKPEIVAEGLPYVDPQARLLVEDVVNQVKFWQSEGQVDKALDPKSVMDLSFVGQ
ncbi:ABC transporter substrate-binding protein [Azospirillum picis]|uniref:NitT/TauT family transport system substrate-binding protein n=1 Tax=Azospirillum picis TaxID=488438 RepID=A0ABU0MQY4_9PROT|nr:ABC transporter substrate-binding protein [Azospirillum picis]MBP2302316.1 NitT/TauT family transport system substrate-binding protein [Azospirillum picis]MDQ0535895.1 NitT/TauT family transport system substrate-binding protein [Azospirillum picis]